MIIYYIFYITTMSLKQVELSIQYALMNEVKIIKKILIIKDIKDQDKYNIILKNLIDEQIDNSKSYIDIVNEYGSNFKEIEIKVDKNDSDEEIFNSKIFVTFLMNNYFNLKYTFDNYRMDVFDYRCSLI